MKPYSRTEEIALMSGARERLEMKAREKGESKLLRRAVKLRIARAKGEFSQESAAKVAC